MAYIGHLFIISAASGVGKTSLVKMITKRLSNLVTSVSYTTRSKRSSERHGVDYFFITMEEFIAIENQEDFLESSLVFDNYYGTNKNFVYNLLAAGKDVILEIDWQGAQKVKHKLLNNRSLDNNSSKHIIECFSIFILPPSLKSLRDRLRSRGQDNLANIQKRLNSAQQEINHYMDYDYIVINDNFNQAVQDLISIINCQRLKRTRQEIVNRSLIKDLLV